MGRVCPTCCPPWGFFLQRESKRLADEISVHWKHLFEHSKSWVTVPSTKRRNVILCANGHFSHWIFNVQSLVRLSKPHITVCTAICFHCSLVNLYYKTINALGQNTSACIDFCYKVIVSIACNCSSCGLENDTLGPNRLFLNQGRT
jgi:hypothetical protein